MHSQRDSIKTQNDNKIHKMNETKKEKYKWNMNIKILQSTCKIHIGVGRLQSVECRQILAN